MPDSWIWAATVLGFGKLVSAQPISKCPHVTPYVTTRSRKLLIWSAIIALAVLYLSGPIVAGVFGIGNRAGPKIYPQAFHEVLYLIAWESSAHSEGKPRLPSVFRSEHRPWFYGMPSKNDDPAWLQAEFEKRRTAATRPTQ